MKSITAIAIVFILFSGMFLMRYEDQNAIGDIIPPHEKSPVKIENINTLKHGTESIKENESGELKPFPEICSEENSPKLSTLSAKPDPMFGDLLASGSTKEIPNTNLEEVSKCALQFAMSEKQSLFMMKAGNLTVEASKIYVTGSNASLSVEAKQGELLVTNKNMQAQCSKFEIKLPYCGPQNGKLYVTARDKIAHFSCDGLHGDFERMTLNSGKVIAELTIDVNRNLLVKLGDAQLKCKSIALELANGQILLDNDINWEESGIEQTSEIKK